MNKFYFKLIFILFSLNSFNAFACMDNRLRSNDFSLSQIGQNTILNGSSVNMYEVISKKCSLECYMYFLDKNKIDFSKQGNIFYISENGGITIQLFDVKKNSFSGRVICKSKNQPTIIDLPNYIKLPKPSTDFQSLDNGSISRTMVFKNYKKIDYLNLVAVIKKYSTSMDINNAFSYFEIKNGDEINLIYDIRKPVNSLVVIYVKKRN